MPIAERDGDRIVLVTEYRERELIKQVPGVKWATDEQLWWVPLSWAACCQLRGVFGTDLKVGTGLGAWAKHELETRIRPCLALRTAEDAEELAMFTKLFPFQRAGAQMLRTARHALLGDDMGLGKTRQAIAALEAIGADAYPALVVVPSNTKFGWAAEFAELAPGRLVEIAGETAAKRKKAIDPVREGLADVLIINYEALRWESRLAPYGTVRLDEKDKQEKGLNSIAWKSVIADEAHRVKDPRSKQTRALWWVSKDAEQRFALSGTPVANSPEDIWTLMRFVAPSEFPAKTRFIERYAQQSYSVYGFMEITGVKGETRDELFQILDPRFIRRTKEAVLPQLPEKIYSTRYVEMVAKQRKPYDEIRKDMVAHLDSGVLLTTNPLTKLIRLSQFASACGEFGDPAFSVFLNGARVSGPFPLYETAEGALSSFPGSTIKDETPLLLEMPSCKVDALLEIAGELGDQNALVFAESRQLIELAAKALVKDGYQVGQLTGAVPEADRMQAVQQFQAGRLKFLLATLGAGGEGLSFPGCTTAIFLQRSFSRIKNEQAEARIHGIGRGDLAMERGSEYIDIVTKDSVEAQVFAAMADKERIMEEIVRDKDTLARWLAK